MRSRTKTSRSFRSLALLSTATPVLLALAPGCGDTINNSYNTYYQGPAAGEGGEGPSMPHAGSASMTDGGSPEMNGGGGSGGSADIDGGAGGEVTSQGGEGGEGGQADDGHALYPDAPYATVEVADQQLDLFGSFGTKFWFGVSQEQLDIMNNGDQGGPFPFGDIYTPGGGNSSGPFVDHLWITGTDGQTADYGKVKVKVVGQSSRRPWSETTIPNLNIDSNDFVKGQLIDAYEHLRLNNAQVGNIFREYLSLHLYQALGYPAPDTSYAFISSNVWGPGVEIPMVLVERYKRRFCERFSDWGNGCNNMWELAGADFGGGFGFPGPKGGGFYDEPNNCQFDKCDSTRIAELDTLLSNTPNGPGFKAATADYIDWPAFHRFQCSEWLMWIGDDVLHNLNNIVLAEGKDGKFRYLPYSTDISIGQDWYQNTPLPGNNRIALGCQADESCWADTISMCEDVIADFKALDPIKMLDDLHTKLGDAGMLRAGDEQRYQTQREWFDNRLASVSDELEQYRQMPTACPNDQVDCGGYCDYPWNCQVCEPPVGKLAPGALAPELIGAGGAPVVDPGPDPVPVGGGGPVCAMINNYPKP